MLQAGHGDAEQLVQRAVPAGRGQRSDRADGGFQPAAATAAPVRDVQPAGQ